MPRNVPRKKLRILIITSFDHPRLRLEAEALREVFLVDYIYLKPLSEILSKKQLFKLLLSSLPLLLKNEFSLRIPPIPVKLYRARLIMWNMP